jgi:dTDP-4-amino-4,6-dideoxygalactose transaminase
MRNIEPGGFNINFYQKILVNKVMDDSRLSYGQMTADFEKQWAKIHQVKYALFCNSGTSALQVALHALKEINGWSDDDEVIIPATTFVATMNIVLQNNMRVVFCDIDRRTFNLDPKSLEKKITKKTKCLIVVHLLGQPAEMDKIMAIAKKHKLKVIEDSCETVAATFKGKMVGSFGDLSCFSTYASHIIVTGVGGFVCTSDPDLAMMVKGLYNHGRDGIYHSIDDDDNIQMVGNRFNFIHSGYSYRLTEMESALGLGHLKFLSKELSARLKNALTLTHGLKELEKANYIVLPYIHPSASHSFMLYPIIIKENRDEVVEYLEQNGIKTRYIMPLTNQPIVKKLFGEIEADYPNSAYINQHGILIGCHPELSKTDLKYIIKVFLKYYEKFKS